MNDEMTNKIKETICIEQTNEVLERIEKLKNLTYVKVNVETIEMNYCLVTLTGIEIFVAIAKGVVLGH